MKNQHVLDLIRRKRLIFTVTTGRSGTAYLSSIFGYIRNVHSYHEPVPEYRKVLRRIQQEPDLARRFLLDEKLPAIARDLADIYVETSHITCKGFLEPLLDLGLVPDLIIHRRAPRDVSLSMYKMGTIPGRTRKGLMFYLSPEDPNVLRLNDWQSLNDYQLCYWYCLEIERRAVAYKKIFGSQRARIAETTLEGLKTLHGLEKMKRDLDLRFLFPAWLTRMRFLRKTRVKVNESKETKKDMGRLKNIEALESDVFERIGSEQLSDWWAESQLVKNTDL